MSMMSPQAIWGEKLELVNRKWDDMDDIFNLRLKAGASDEEKESFEDYAMNGMGGAFFLKAEHPEMREPYYTWEGKVVEKASLKGRKPSPVKTVKSDKLL